jgi:hypothetical protein
MVPLVGILGAFGAVGRRVAHRLQASSMLRLRLGARDPDAVRQMIQDPLYGYAECMQTDIGDPASLASFCESCQVVVNCAGPSFRIMDRVALPALAAGADYVDPGGDEPVYFRLAVPGSMPTGRIAILTACMMPGLSGLLPRFLARQGFDRTTRLTAYVGGRGDLTKAGAADYILSLASSGRDSLAAWRNGARVVRALKPLVEVDLPFFPSGVTAHPFLSYETERVARSLQLEEVSWYNVFEGGRMLSALGRLQGAAAEADLSTAIKTLVHAAELDRFGRLSYQLFVLQLEGQTGGRPLRRTLMLRGTDAHDLTAAITTRAVTAMLNGEVQPGLHFAADALSPEIVNTLRDDPSVTAFENFDTAGIETDIEEGAL